MVGPDDGFGVTETASGDGPPEPPGPRFVDPGDAPVPPTGPVWPERSKRDGADAEAAAWPSATRCTPATDRAPIVGALDVCATGIAEKDLGPEPLLPGGPLTEDDTAGARRDSAGGRLRAVAAAGVRWTPPSAPVAGAAAPRVTTFEVAAAPGGVMDGTIVAGRWVIGAPMPRRTTVRSDPDVDAAVDESDEGEPSEIGGPPERSALEPTVGPTLSAAPGDVVDEPGDAFVDALPVEVVPAAPAEMAALVDASGSR